MTDSPKKPAAKANVDTAQAENERRLQQRAAAFAQAFDGDGKLKTSPEDWTPEGPYGSTAMKDFANEYGILASDIVKDFPGGK